MDRRFKMDLTLEPLLMVEKIGINTLYVLSGKEKIPKNCSFPLTLLAKTLLAWVDVGAILKAELTRSPVHADPPAPRLGIEGT